VSFEDNFAILYELKPAMADSEHTAETMQPVHRGRLSDEKTFESLLREALTNPDRCPSAVTKLVFWLLSSSNGPPGSGKTSLIVWRSVLVARSSNALSVEFPTNAELQSIFFDRTYHVQGSTSQSLGYKDIIFVMEDVDASKVVKRRRC
jgi:hypothetical protein